MAEKKSIPTKNANMSRVSVLQKVDTIETDFYKSLIDSFSFDKYQVSGKYIGKKVKIDLKDYEDSPREIVDNIAYQYNNEKQPNFAGHYIIVTWGCGSPCQMNAIIDVKTGKTMASFSTSAELSYKPDSYLLIRNPPSGDRYDEDFRLLIGKPRMTVFKNNKLTDITH